MIPIELLKEVFSWHITIQLVCADAGYRGKLGDPFDIREPLAKSGSKENRQALQENPLFREIVDPPIRRIAIHLRFYQGQLSKQRHHRMILLPLKPMTIRAIRHSERQKRAFLDSLLSRTVRPSTDAPEAAQRRHSTSGFRNSYPQRIAQPTGSPHP